MFCPKCNYRLTITTNEEAYCPNGEMYLSQRMTRRLKECYVEKVDRSVDKIFPFEIGGKWFCPGCGILADEKPKGSIGCSECGQSLNEFIYELIERSPHKTENNTQQLSKG